MMPLAFPPKDAGVPTAVRAAPATIAADDWDILFRAVTSRLHLSTDAPAARVQSIVLECVQALEQLHAMLVIERRRSGAPALQSLVIERFVRPPMSRERDAAARKFASACSPGPASPRSRT